jgi:predicted transcriptional regulator
MATEGTGYRDATGRFHLKANEETIRLSLDVSPELYETLNTLAAKLHTTKSDVLRKAVALLEVAVRAKEEHKKFGVAAPDQALETEIVGL